MAEHAAPELPKRCHHCAGPLSKDMETSSWTVTPLVRDSFSMIGSAVGGTAGAFYAFNHAMPVVRRYIKGPMWMHFLVGAPPVVVFSSACAGLADFSPGLHLTVFVTNYKHMIIDEYVQSKYIQEDNEILTGVAANEYWPELHSRGCITYEPRALRTGL